MLPIEIWCGVAEYLTYPEEQSLRATSKELSSAGRLDLSKPNIVGAVFVKTIPTKGCIRCTAFLGDYLLISDNKINHVFPHYVKLPTGNIPWIDHLHWPENPNTSIYSMRAVSIQGDFEKVSRVNQKIRCGKVFGQNVYTGYKDGIEIQDSSFPSEEGKRTVPVNDLVHFEVIDETHILIREKTRESVHKIQCFDLSTHQRVGNAIDLQVSPIFFDNYDLMTELNSDMALWNNHLITILRADRAYSPIYMKDMNNSQITLLPGEVTRFHARCFQIYRQNIYVGTEAGTIAVFDPATKQKIQEKRIDSWGIITSILVDRGIVYAGSHMGILSICDAITLKVLKVFNAHQASIMNIQIQGNYVATQTYKEIKILNLFPEVSIDL